MTPRLAAADVAALVTSVLHEEAAEVVPLVGHGDVNTVFRVRTATSQVVLRLNDDAGAADVYRKEQWCLEQAAAQAIPGPRVLARGQWGRTAYMVLSLVAGENGAESPVDSLHLWRTLGTYARRIHAVPVVGLGGTLQDPARGLFDSPRHDGLPNTWSSYVRYNVASLSGADPMLALGVYTPTQQPRLRKMFDALDHRPLPVGLTHGDLSAKNTVVDHAGVIHLLDWGEAQVHLVPHKDLAEVLFMQITEGNPTADEFQAFVAGYGLSATTFAALHREIATVLLLRRFDTLRWAIDRYPEGIAYYADVARQVLDYTLQLR